MNIIKRIQQIFTNRVNSLGAKFILLISVTILSGLITVMAYFWFTYNHKLNHQLDEHGKLLGTYLSNISPESILSYDYIRLNELTQELLEYSHTLLVAIVDPKDTVLTINYVPEVSANESSGNFHDTASFIGLINKYEGDSNFIVQKYPIVFLEQNIGNTYIVLTKENINKQLIENLVIEFIVSLVLLALLILIISLFFKKLVLSPIEQLVKGSNNFANGTHERALKKQSNDELGILTDTFNNMVKSVNEKQFELINSHRQVEEQLWFQQQLINKISLPIFYKDKQGKFLGCNNAFETLLGLTKEQILGKTIMEVYKTENAEEIHDKEQQLINTGNDYKYETDMTFDDGTVHSVIISKSCFNDRQGKTNGLVGVLFDITERKVIEKSIFKLNEGLEQRIHERTESLNKVNFELQQSNAYFNTVINMISDPIMVIDAKSFQLKLVNNAVLNNFDTNNLDSDNLTCHSMIYGHSRPCYQHDIVCPINEILQTKQEVTLTHRRLTKNGKEKHIEINAFPMFDNMGGVSAVIQMHKDVTERINNLQQLKTKADTDSLTGIYNRSKFEVIIQDILSFEYESIIKVGIIFFDIDFFKRINDTYGHDNGDEVLKIVVDSVKQQLRRSDFFARWGGDEFIIIISDISKSKIVAIAEQLRKTIEKTDFKFINNITLSFGVTLARQGDSKESIIERVDNALYQSKQRGRNQVTYV